MLLLFVCEGYYAVILVALVGILLQPRKGEVARDIFVFLMVVCKQGEK